MILWIGNKILERKFTKWCKWETKIYWSWFIEYIKNQENMSDRLHCVVTTNKRQQKSNHNAQIVLSLGMEHINIDIPIPINGLYSVWIFNGI